MKVWEWLRDLIGTAAVSGALLLAAAWLARKWFTARLDASIKINTENQLAEFQARLDSAEARIATVRDAGIETNLQLSAVVLAERVAAIKALWHGIVDWRAATAVSMIMAAFTTQYVRRHANDQNLADSIRQMLDGIKHKELMAAANKLNYWRPFVTQRAWALFEAYNGYYMLRMARGVALMFRNRELAERLWQTNGELRIVQATAPHLAGEYATNELATQGSFLGFVEKEFLGELQKSLAGEHSGAEATLQAAAIVATANSALIAAQTAAAPQVPPP